MTVCITSVANLPSLAQPLLAPDRLIATREVLADRTIIPDAGGVYGCWFNAPLPGVPLDGTLEKDGYRLLYIGIAPRKPSAAGSESKSTLRKRITRNHLGNRVASSTLRRSLAWLLHEQMGFAIDLNRAGKQVMAAVQEASLTGWMRDHAALSFVVDPAPWDLEDRLIQGGPKLPINIRGSGHPFSVVLRKMRGNLQFTQY